MPPYITNAGKIYERVSSGSVSIKDSSMLSQLYTKREDQLKRIHKKIGLEPIPIDSLLPNNICGHLDLGFSLTCSELTKLQKEFYIIDFTKIRDILSSLKSPYTISRSGESYIISIGKAIAHDNLGNTILLGNGVGNFIEILYDGSVRCRTIILSEENNIGHANLFLVTGMTNIYKQIYNLIMNESLHKKFLYAQKYQQLCVIRQFVPTYDVTGIIEEPHHRNRFISYVMNHDTKYGGNYIVIGSRIPRNDFKIRDKRWFQTVGIPYTTENIVDELFASDFYNMGFIDPFPFMSENED